MTTATTASAWRPITARDLVEDRMPYGVFYTPDRTEWLFNRRYQVIAVRRNGIAREWLDRSFWVPDIMQQCTRFVHNGNPAPHRAKYKRTAADNEARSAAIWLLRDWGLPTGHLGR